MVALWLLACVEPVEECYPLDPSYSGVGCDKVDLCCTGDEPCLLRTHQDVEYRCMPDDCDAAQVLVWCDPDVCVLAPDAGLHCL